MGKDTIVCEKLILTAPSDYYWYLWNDSLSNSNEYVVNQTGLVTLSCANENACWTIPDSIYIIVDEMPEISLKDTSMKLSDTLVFELPEGYDSYLWSTGDTSSQITLPGQELGIGLSEIWVTVEKVFVVKQTP